MDIVPQTLASALPCIQLKVLITECAEYRLALRGSQAVGLRCHCVSGKKEGGPESRLEIEQPAWVPTWFCHSSCVTLGLWPIHSEPVSSSVDWGSQQAHLMGPLVNAEGWHVCLSSAHSSPVQ